MILQQTDSLIIADTVLRGAEWMPAADSLSVGDSVLFAIENIPESAVTTAEAVYGPASMLAITPDVVGQATGVDLAPLTGNVFYDLATLVCFISLCLIVYYYRGYAFGIFGVLHGGATTEKILDQKSKVFGAFLMTVISLGLFMTGLCTLKFADLLFGEYLDGLPGWMSVLPIFGAWGAAALIWGWQFVSLKTAGGLTLSKEFVGRLFFLKKIVAAVGTIAALPVFLLFALSDGQSANILAILIAGIAALLTIFLIVRTFMLFIRHNFSISLWFLYFCAVEIFPVSLAAILMARSLE